MNTLPDNRPKRTHLRVIARQTQQMLFGLLIGFSFCLFVAQLFLMNRLSMDGYQLTRGLQNQQQLLVNTQDLESQIARLQTQELVGKLSGGHEFISRREQNFVVIPSRLTAQNFDSATLPR